MSRELTAEQLAQLRADIERRKALPAFDADTAIERIKVINATQRSFTLEVVEALLDELERKDKRIAELKFVCEIADQVQREYAEALGCAGDNESILVAIDEIKSRIAELEARTVTVRLPAHKYRECVNGLLEEAIAYAGTQQLRERLSSRLANFVQPDHPHTRCAAGINLTVED